MHKILYYTLLILITFYIGTVEEAYANAISPRPISDDGRFKVISYSPRGVYKFTGNYGYHTTIEFGKDEIIQAILMGDSAGWEIVNDGNEMHVKPLSPYPETNMTLVTNKRRYYFELDAINVPDITDERITFHLKFLYPSEIEYEKKKISNIYNNRLDTMSTNFLQPDDLKNTSLKSELNNESVYSILKRKFSPNVNWNYRVSGDISVTPIEIFDDGEFTFLQFESLGQELPAIFQVDIVSGKEYLINYQTHGSYIVIESVDKVFTLRNGERIACVFNEYLYPRDSSR